MLDKILALLKPSVDVGIKLQGISTYIGKMLDKIDNRIVNLEARQLQKGDKGDSGKDGKNGKDGKDGKDGLNGLNGKDGKDGKNGKDGKEGISIVDTYLAADGNLMVKLSNGKEIDAGSLGDLSAAVGTVINTQVAKDQITVSTTAPASPVLNQLWYDIS